MYYRITTALVLSLSFFGCSTTSAPTRIEQGELQPLMVRYFFLECSKPSEIKPALDTVLTERGDALAVDSAKTMIVRDIQKGLLNAGSLISTLEDNAVLAGCNKQGFSKSIGTASLTLDKDLRIDLRFSTKKDGKGRILDAQVYQEQQGVERVGGKTSVPPEEVLKVLRENFAKYARPTESASTNN